MPPTAGPEFRKTSIEFQAKTHNIAIKILKALFLGLGWDENLVDDVSGSREPSLPAPASPHLTAYCPSLPLLAPC